MSDHVSIHPSWPPLPAAEAREQFATFCQELGVDSNDIAAQIPLAALIVGPFDTYVAEFLGVPVSDVTPIGDIMRSNEIWITDDGPPRLGVSYDESEATEATVFGEIILWTLCAKGVIERSDP